MQYYVRIIETATGKIEREMGPMSETKANKVEAGAGRNLNHDDYHTAVISDDDRNKETKRGEEAKEAPV